MPPLLRVSPVTGHRRGPMLQCCSVMSTHPNAGPADTRPILISLNAEAGAPAFVQLLPAGIVRGLDGRVWLNSDPQAILARFADRGQPMVIDYEHANHLRSGEPMPAAGWVHALENRNGEIWGQTEWTDRAAAMIAAREYRFLSPVFRFDEAGQITQLLDAGLTNKPNLSMTALNREQPEQPENPTMEKEKRTALCRALELADDATDDAIVTAASGVNDRLRVALNRVDQPPMDRFVPRGDFDALQQRLDVALNRLSDVEAAGVSELVDAAIRDGKIVPSSRAFYVAACKTAEGRDEFARMIAATPRLAGAGFGAGGGASAATAGQAASGGALPRGGALGTALNKEQNAILSSLGLDPNDRDLIAEVSGRASTGAYSKEIF